MVVGFKLTLETSSEVLGTAGASATAATTAAVDDGPAKLFNGTGDTQDSAIWPEKSRPSGARRIAKDR